VPRINDPVPRIRLAVLASHPIQYQAPLFRRLATVPGVDLHVFFCCRWGAESYLDPEFQTSFSWDVPLLDGYRFDFLPNWGFGSGPTGFWSLVNPRVVSVIARGSFDALWIHGWSIASNWLAWAAASARHIPVLLRGESTGFEVASGVKGIVKRFALRVLFNRIAGFLTIGTNNRNFYKSYGVSEQRLFCTPYSVDNAFFLNAAQRLVGQKRSLRTKDGIDPNLPVILFCGKLVEKKRPLDLLEAYRLLGSSPRASLVLAGEGPLRPTMERFAAENRLANVHFLGFRNQSEVCACYAMADVLVLPSSLETWGLVLNEAMCFGLPVIASDRVGAAADLVKQGANGFVHPVGQPRALAECISQVLVDDRTRAAMGRRSFELIQGWSFAEDTEGILNALRKVTAANLAKRVPASVSDKLT
jgi:glycosyltransferase involved in cell wall biosynthesis